MKVEIKKAVFYNDGGKIEVFYGVFIDNKLIKEFRTEREVISFLIGLGVKNDI